MLDAALIKECADPSLKPAIVEQFVHAVGSDDPLAITVKSGDRLILVPKPRNSEEAIQIVRENVGNSVVRVGLTQFPAGIGIKDPSKLNDDLVDPCSNLRMGTAQFAKILHIVARWYGNPTSEEVFPQLFDDAVHAWKTGEFEGETVFQEQGSGEAILQQSTSPEAGLGEKKEETPVVQPTEVSGEPYNAGIRIDLTRIGGQK
ncbi:MULTISPECIES: TraH family protein [unclassified Rhizobium]|uniref:TraH family protein n=1 Tax=unclassified Rhizobium TaxID=2613769 RepID=UPI0006FC5AEA|nr:MULTISPECIES: TraH family protein [unclassified Rhizobium]KQV39921.1 conjugal transfer protein TraH [Rhizobium sp. Root1212]KRD31631.1 conjugal transfer protein TraH [Rhizobium sp. Root268]